jgi:hypothetical protein
MLNKKVQFGLKPDARAPQGLDSVIVEHTIPENYDMLIGDDMEVAHGLGRKAQGIIAMDGAPIILGAKSPTDTKIYIKGMISGKKVKFLVY